MLGLKDFHGTVKGAKLSWKIERFIDALKMAWQRAWYGYGLSECYDLYYYSMERLHANLIEFKNNNIAIWRDANDGHEMNEDELNNVLDRMIYLSSYENMDVDELLYKTKDKYEKCYQQVEKNKNELFDLLKDYWFQLWI